MYTENPKPVGKISIMGFHTVSLQDHVTDHDIRKLKIATAQGKRGI
jgi:hypothetical protein